MMNKRFHTPLVFPTAKYCTTQKCCEAISEFSTGFDIRSFSLTLDFQTLCDDLASQKAQKTYVVRVNYHAVLART